jgi:hypothetical protein
METCISKIDFDNARFEAIWGLPQPHIDLLLENRLVYGTEAVFSAGEAKAALSYRVGAEDGIEWTAGRYGGYVVAPRPGDLVAARRVAARRPFGETVERLVVDYFTAEDGTVREEARSPTSTIGRCRRN